MSYDQPQKDDCQRCAGTGKVFIMAAVYVCSACKGTGKAGAGANVVSGGIK